MNPYPQKKSFNEHNTDFSFNVNYAELDYLPEYEIADIGSLNGTAVFLQGLAEAFKKLSGESVETRTPRRISKWTNWACQFVAKSEEESPLSKLENTTSKLVKGDEASEGYPVTAEKPPIRDDYLWSGVIFTGGFLDIDKLGSIDLKLTREFTCSSYFQRSGAFLKHGGTWDQL